MTFYHPKTHVCVVGQGDDLTFAATESEQRKMRSRIDEWNDVKVRGVLGSGKRAREIEMLRRSLWMEERLKYEASDTPGTARRVWDWARNRRRQQCSCQTTGYQESRGREHAGRSGEEEVQAM